MPTQTTKVSSLGRTRGFGVRCDDGVTCVGKGAKEPVAGEGYRRSQNLAPLDGGIQVLAPPRSLLQSSSA